MVKITSRNLHQLGGPIVLKAGRHKGPHRGFGVRHIWAERGRELTKYGYPTIHDVAVYVASIIANKASIMCEFNGMGSNQRLIVMKGRAGCVILEGFNIPNDSQQLMYSVVTAFKGKNPEGQIVGTVQT